MSINADEFNIVINNERIWNFYNDNPSIDIETANIMLIDFMENIFNEMIEEFKDNFIKVMRRCYYEEHNFLYINTNSQRLFCNWDEIILKQDI